ncbi:hypothetical protein [Streptomyces zagrosensis]|uniref:Uncharacterized protein n=1 Tax=Streptomyces zagrosensis TaxID=1042984 RepID=A0A7W9V0H5_9ACTN|nr:hypothetical protein [Streptomyces zagrosensis]MBB5938193.1 hypothetical protein [Streptomyces zagrosensis]
MPREHDEQTAAATAGAEHATKRLAANDPGTAEVPFEPACQNF